MSEHIVEDEFTNRPDDDDLAFLHYEKLFRGPLEKELAALREPEQNNYWDSYNHFMQTYINCVLATAKELDIGILEHWINSPSNAQDPENFKQIKYDIDATITQLKVRHAQVIRKASVRLEPNIREKIRGFRNKIKITLEGIDIPLPRKEALMSKLNAFAAEVDRDRTRFEQFGALVIEAAEVAGKAERKIRPILKWIGSIAGAMREATTLEVHHPRLPAPQRRIEPPKATPTFGRKPPRPAEKPTENSTEIDDDIPF